MGVSAESDDFLSVRYLSETQERFAQFAFAANGHFGKAIEPFGVRDFGFGFQPNREEFELIEIFAIPCFLRIQARVLLASSFTFDLFERGRCCRGS